MWGHHNPSKDIIYQRINYYRWNIVPPLVDHTRYFRHAPARLRVAANMFGLACGYAAMHAGGTLVRLMR